MENVEEEHNKPTAEHSGILRASDFKKIYVTNVKGGLTSQDFRFELMNEKIENADGKFLVSEGMIILSAIGAKRLHIQLTKAVEDFEQKYGPIPENPKEEIYIKAD